MEREKILEKIESLFREESWGRIDPKEIGVSKFRILEDLLNNVESVEMSNEIAEVCRQQLTEHPQSITARYLLGINAYETNMIEEKGNLKALADLFVSNHKWAVVEHISQKILEYGENRSALKTLSIALERLSRQREAIPVWEELLKIDRFDSEVAKKLSFALMEEDPQKGIYYMKLSLEAFIRNNEFDEVSAMWSKIIPAAWEDIVYFERIERMLIEGKRKDLAVEMNKSLIKKYRDADVDQTIQLYKRLLDYIPDDIHARNDLVRLYREKYAQNSQLEQFVKISRLDSPRTAVGPAIKAFENYVIFDVENYVDHRSWGLGRIVSMDSENVVVDFKEKQSHAMSLQMALQSLTPIAKDHLRARQLDDPESIQKLFSHDVVEFFRVLLRSYGGKVSSSQIKKEIIPQYLEQSSWSKWWTKAKSEMRKDPMFGFDEPKTGDLFFREKPVSYLEEILDSFRRASSFSGRLDAAMEFVNNIDVSEGKESAGEFVSYFSDAAKIGSMTKLVLSYFSLKKLSAFSDEVAAVLPKIESDVVNFIRESRELPIVSAKIADYDNKKDFINLIISHRADWQKFIPYLLFETPIRAHRYIVNALIKAHAYSEINSFIEKATVVGKQSPEIIVWISKNLLSGDWSYEWLDYSKERLIVSFMRMVCDVRKIETKGTRLRSIVQEMLIEEDASLYTTIISQCDPLLAGRIYALVCASDIFTDGQLDKMLKIIQKVHTNFKPEDMQRSGEEPDYEEQIIVTQNGLERKTNEYNTMVSIDMSRLQKDLSAASDVSADLRENVDYNALMEQQSVLKQSIARLDSELKKAKTIDFNSVDISVVSVGTRVTLEGITGGTVEYAILGPWDADYENGILSYRSPLARALLKKKVGDEVKVNEVTSFKILKIERYN